ncbi:MAG: competence protein ComEA [Sulfurimonas sp.]|jgi:competence protein ComEA|uniref:ComEA family DNA-binding protein n=1 Tax=Sulfurimonas sp. TaxID=2022749 RepID=UPI0039E412CD
MKILTMMLLGMSLLFGAVDINTATKKELTGLNGIGSTKADMILSYRDIKCFKNIDELTNVKGIGKKTVLKNKDNLTASACKKK